MEIFIRTTQTSHEIADVKKHKQIAGSLKTARLPRDIKHVRRSP